MSKLKKWIDLKEWHGLVNGNNCPMCNEIKNDEYDNGFSFKIQSFNTGILRLVKNQFTPGYCIFISKKHLIETFELSQESRNDFFNEIMIASQALKSHFKPIKINYFILGNLIPHLHCHIMPRYYNDPAPGTILDLDKNIKLLDKNQYKDYVDKIKNEIDKLLLIC